MTKYNESWLQAFNELRNTSRHYEFQGTAAAQKLSYDLAPGEQLDPHALAFIRQRFAAWEEE